MPLVRVSGSDAESFDTFDVAEMTDNHSQQRNWSSRLSQSKNALCPTPETDELTSLDSSSGKRSEEADRGSFASRGGMPRGHSYSSNSVGSNSDNMPNSYNSYNSNPPLYETVDNLDEMQQDPRNPYNKNHNTLRTSWGWGDDIPEEDEISLSTMEDASVSPSIQQQQSHHQNQHPKPNTQRSHRHRQNQSYTSEADDISISSHQSRQDFSNNHKTRNNDNSSHIIQQLESQVAKINFELATTKSSLDELQLENRRLYDDKDKLTTNIKSLQEENDQLYLKVEKMEKKMEKETILRNMEGTKGVTLSSTDQDSYVVWGKGGGASIVPSNRVYVPVTKQRLGKVGGDSLEVPFLSTSNRSSLRSVTSFNELSIDDDCASRCHSALSVEFSDCDDDLGNFQSSADDQGESQERGKLGILSMIGKLPSVRDATKQMEKASISLQSRRDNKPEKEAETLTQSSPSKQQDSDLEVGEADDNDIGSNPQGEDFNDDDPFSTWSERGDPKRKEPVEQNWLQRGLGGRMRDIKNSRQPPQSNEIIEDPFDSCNDGQQRNNNIDDDAEKYTSFADNPDISGSNDGDNVQERKRFGLFKGLIGGGRRSS